MKNHEQYYRAQLKARADGGSGAGTPPSIPLVKDRSRAQKTEGTKEWAKLTMNNYKIITADRKKARGRPPIIGYDIEKMVLQEMVDRRCVWKQSDGKVKKVSLTVIAGITLRLCRENEDKLPTVGGKRLIVYTSKAMAEAACPAEMPLHEFLLLGHVFVPTIRWAERWKNSPAIRWVSRKENRKALNLTKQAEEVCANMDDIGVLLVQGAFDTDKDDIMRMIEDKKLKDDDVFITDKTVLPEMTLAGDETRVPINPSGLTTLTTVGVEGVQVSNGVTDAQLKAAATGKVIHDWRKIVKVGVIWPGAWQSRAKRDDRLSKPIHRKSAKIVRLDHALRTGELELENPDVFYWQQTPSGWQTGKTMRQLADEEMIPLVEARRGGPALYKDIHGLDIIPADARALFLSDVHISHLDEVFGKRWRVQMFGVGSCCRLHGRQAGG